MIQALLAATLAISAVATFASACGAHFFADYLKRNRTVKNATPDFVTRRSTFFLGGGISLRDLYSNAHRTYENVFITRCVYTARVAFPTMLLAFAGLILTIST
jgi:hypothetical protein